MWRKREDSQNNTRWRTQGTNTNQSDASLLGSENQTRKRIHQQGFIRKANLANHLAKRYTCHLKSCPGQAYCSSVNSMEGVQFSFHHSLGYHAFRQPLMQAPTDYVPVIISTLHLITTPLGPVDRGSIPTMSAVLLVLDLSAFRKSHNQIARGNPSSAITRCDSNRFFFSYFVHGTLTEKCLAGMGNGDKFEIREADCLIVHARLWTNLRASSRSWQQQNLVFTLMFSYN